MSRVTSTNVGIVAIEVYFPFRYVDQSALEAFDEVSSGKYTVGLGQKHMAVCGDNEDVNSFSLTVVQNLMDRLELSYGAIGRLEVGTETIVDKSKSVKTVLMTLFEESGNHDVEGIDSTSACYGGTAALFNSVAWVESSSWDGRYAMVVAGDIAVYASGSARCTGGAGAVAMLIGPDAPIYLEPGMRSSHMTHVYDFYKPNLSSEYPCVDGSLSIECYLKSLDACYAGFLKKCNLAGRTAKLSDFDALVFHSPYCKLVQKSVARLSFQEFLLRAESDDEPISEFRNFKLEETYFNKELEKAFMNRSKDLFEEKTKPSLSLASRIGNMCTASLYGCLISWISNSAVEKLADCRIGMFSYGSGSASSFYSLRTSADANPGSPLSKLHASCKNLDERLGARSQVPPHVFDEIMKRRENAYNKASYRPLDSRASLFPGTWFLTEIDDKWRRFYDRKPL